MSGLLHREVSRGALMAGLPGQAGKLADAVMDVTGEPKTLEPRTIRSVTVKVARTEVIVSGMLLLLVGAREVYA